jgi:hypothetical protein
MNAFQLYNENGKPTGLWCCGQCRMVALNPLWGSGKSSEKNTREGAEACCRPQMCVTCGTEKKTNNYDPDCHRCRDDRWDRERAERDAKRLENAEDVTDSYSGPVYLDGVSGDWGDGFHSDVGSLADAIDEEIADRDPEEVPPDWLREVWAFCCKPKQQKLDLEDAIHRLCEDGYDDMFESLAVPKSLQEAIDEFNRVNETALTIWNVDYSRKVRLERTE